MRLAERSSGKSNVYCASGAATCDSGASANSGREPDRPETAAEDIDEDTAPLQKPDVPERAAQEVDSPLLAASELACRAKARGIPVAPSLAERQLHRLTHLPFAAGTSHLRWAAGVRQAIEGRKTEPV